MITFVKEDDNLPAIEEAVNFGEYKPKRDYKIAGGLQEDNPAVGIRYDMDKNRVTEIEDDLRDFFKTQGLDLGFEHHAEPGFIICLRRDIRNDVPLCAGIVATIIYHLEGQLELDSNYKIPGLDKYPTTEVNP